jgi:hypothetical protein
MGALAAWDIFAPPIEKKLWTNWNPIRKLIGTSGLKEGAVLAVGEQPPLKRRTNCRKVRHHRQRSRPNDKEP